MANLQCNVAMDNSVYQLFQRTNERLPKHFHLKSTPGQKGNNFIKTHKVPNTYTAHAQLKQWKRMLLTFNIVQYSTIFSLLRHLGFITFPRIHDIFGNRIRHLFSPEFQFRKYSYNAVGSGWLVGHLFSKVCINDLHGPWILGKCYFETS